jgi:coenzyme F420-0:L-glutamate ligase/coenzyme F420-1:gamma-L-glutamate ligase
VILRTVELLALPDFPLVAPDTDLPALVEHELDRHGLALREGDIVVLAQKIVSKAEGCFVALDTVTPSAEAMRFATETGKDARIVEVILRESNRVVRIRPNLLIVEHRQGFVMANAGIDQSNIGTNLDQVLLLPHDADASAEGLRQHLADRYGARIGVVINDSFGRAWRQGVCGVAVGTAGLPALIDKRGDNDLFGRELKVTVIGFADEVAAAASLVMGQADEGRPVVVVRGLSWPDQPGQAIDIVRPPDEDLFR